MGKLTTLYYYLNTAKVKYKTVGYVYDDIERILEDRIYEKTVCSGSFLCPYRAL